MVFSEVEDTAEELQTLPSLKDFTSDNPWKLKQILNTHRFIKILLQRPETPPTEDVQRKLASGHCHRHDSRRTRWVRGPEGASSWPSG